MTRIIWMICLVSMLFALSCGDEGSDDDSARDADGWAVEDAGDGRSDVSDPAADTGLDTWAPDAFEDISETPDDADSASDTEDVEDDTEHVPSHRTLSDYRRCHSDVDCPVGLGDCVKSVSLNRPDGDGTEEVAIAQVFPSLEDGEGICTFVCTNGEDVCGGLSVNGTTPDEIAHTCQLVVLGEAPYPGALPAFPFDDQLNPAEQILGQPFGAICRPPFRLDPGVEASFGTPCAMPDGCESPGALCFNFVTMAEAVDGESGACLTPCDDAGCALGFFCDAANSEGEMFCRPELDTFSACQDVDGDGFGSGLCADGANRVTPHDCDDRNLNAYFDAADSEHAFPTFCGEFDYNCNGLSDEAEQVGAAVYPEEHCASCFDVCAGPVPNGQKACRALDTLTMAATCQATCADTSGDGLPDFADCDGDLSNGCEMPVDDPTRLYYRDADGDGYGDPNEIKFACDPMVPPPGYVANADDCNDTSPLVYGGETPAAEICDGLDNNCNGVVDEPVALLQAGQECNSPETGVCKPGSWVCGGVEGWACVPNIAPGALQETCDGLDNNCNGQIDEHWVESFPPPVISGYQAIYPDADRDGYGAASAAPTYVCATPIGFALNNGDCDDANPQANPGQAELCSTAFDDNCDGHINEGSAADAVLYYPDADADGYGENGAGQMICNPGAGWVLDAGDCDDLNPYANPGMAEQCSTSFDDNCSGENNEYGADDGVTYYRDLDGDQFGDPDDWVVACEQPATYVPAHHTGGLDCDDARVGVNPMAAEICNGLDDNCNATVDGGCPDGTTYKVGDAELKRVHGYSSSSFSDTQCPADTVLVGLRVYRGTHSEYHYSILVIGVICAPITVVSNSAPLGTEQIYTTGHGPLTHIKGPGGVGPNNPQDFVCPAGHALFKIQPAFDHAAMRNLRVYCRKYAAQATPDSETSPYSIHSVFSETGSTSEFDFGETSYGEGASSECNTDQVIGGVHLRHGKNSGGWWGIHMMRIYCHDLALGTK